MIYRIFAAIIIRTKRQFQAFTGITIELFDQMVIEFAKAIDDQQSKEYRNHRNQRKRRPGGGRKGALTTPEIKLFFILFYLKNYPTFDVLGGLFNLSPSNAKENVDKLLPILIQLEKNNGACPHRHFIPKPNATSSHEPKPNATSSHEPKPNATSSHEPESDATSNHEPKPNATSSHEPKPNATSSHEPEFDATSNHEPKSNATSNHEPKSNATSNHEPKSNATSNHEPKSNATPNHEAKLKEIQEIDVDVTERRCRRPQHARKQKNYYSGKKKTHTMKNTIISDRKKTGIIVVGPTAAGRHHDYSLFKNELNPDEQDLSSVDASFDLGYQGVENDFPTFNHIHIPDKKAKKSKNCPNPKLTPQQKKKNRAISRLRIGVEHAIGDLKFFQSLAAQFRNRTIKMADQVILAVAGLCNLKNNYVVP